MKYLTAVITLPHEFVEETENLLVVNGFSYFETHDFADLDAVAGRMFYDYIDDKLIKTKNASAVIKIYLSLDEEGQKAFDLIKDIVIPSSSGASKTVLTSENIDTADWENNWKEFFHPFNVGNCFTVSPTWEKPAVPVGRALIEIDPGGAFGSGTHATTRLCLELCEKFAPNAKKILDIGCGSGILGIGAALVSDNAQIDAVDIDPVAVKICKENFIQNHIKSDRYRIFCGDATEDDASAIKLSEKYDLIFANIVAGVIIELGSFFANKLNKKGKLIASGIITERMNEVVEAMKAYGFEKEDGLSLEGWECIVFSL